MRFERACQENRAGIPRLLLLGGDRPGHLPSEWEIVGQPAEADLIALYVPLHENAEDVVARVRRDVPRLPILVLAFRGTMAQALAVMRLPQVDVVLPEEMSHLAARAQRLLRQGHDDTALQRLRELFDRVFDYVVVLDVDADDTPRVSWMSRRAMRLVGHNARSLREKGWEHLIHPEDLPLTLSNLQRVMGGEQTKLQCRIMTRWGEIRWVRVFSVPRRNGEGRVIGFVAACQDVTPEREVAVADPVEISVRRSAERFRSVFHTLPIGMTLVDSNYRVLEVNEAMCRMLGYTELELMSMRVFDWTHPDDREATREAAGPAFAGQVPSFSFEKRFVRRDGEVLSVHVTGSVICDERGERYVVGMIENVTDRVRAQEALRKSEEQLRQAHKMEALGRLAGGIAHDFNNLLSVISGYGELALTRIEAGHVARTHVQELLYAAERAAGLIRQLLTLGRKQLLYPRALNLNTVTLDSQGIITCLLGEAVHLELELAPELGWVMADPGQIEQILMNLVTNARDAMPDGGTITVRTRNVELPAPDIDADLPSGPWCMLCVTDTGHGMPESVRSHVFEPFFTTKPPGRGTGLGLSTVYGIVQACRGGIVIDSEVDRGTCFCVMLPRVEQPVEVEPMPQVPTVVRAGPETLLLVEDQNMVRQMCSTILQDCGYTVLEASDGTEALRVSESWPGAIDLVLTDVMMPELSGPELTERLVHTRPNVKVLYMSGHLDNVRLNLRCHGGLLEKPFTPDALTRRVREVLNGVH
ncbi:MAG: PAS domain S-box protein [Candidatus Xenobia bacterium]